MLVSGIVIESFGISSLLRLSTNKRSMFETVAIMPIELDLVKVAAAGYAFASKPPIHFNKSAKVSPTLTSNI
ncbi:hypothetical protein D3C86_2194320 [compost metagenome]